MIRDTGWEEGGAGSGPGFVRCLVGQCGAWFDWHLGGDLSLDIQGPERCIQNTQVLQVLPLAPRIHVDASLRPRRIAKDLARV